jgi:hypothetical protein
MICVFDNPAHQNGCIFADPSAPLAVVSDSRGAMNTILFNQKKKLIDEDDLLIMAAREFMKRLIV